MKKTILFDMDGTLTKPRGPMSIAMCKKLTQLQHKNFKIGIVSGSDFDYIMDQCKIMTEINNFDFTSVDFYPCNGTKYYLLKNNGQKVTVYENYMKNQIGQAAFNDIMYTLSGIQSDLRHESWSNYIPLTGNFIQYRGSMINYCPIGRNATLVQRKSWVALDKKHNIRQRIYDRYFLNSDFCNLTVKFGGETSFDIYPAGWDKTFCLNNFNEDDILYFVGDKCDKNGNDKEIYDAVLKSSGNAFKTIGPDNTLKIIDEILQESKNE